MTMRFKPMIRRRSDVVGLSIFFLVILCCVVTWYAAMIGQGHYGMGKSAYEKRQYSEAVKNYRLAVLLRFPCERQYGLALYRHGDKTAAEAVLRDLPDDQNARIALAVILFEQGKNEEAKRILQSVMHRANGFTQALAAYNLSVIYRIEGNLASSAIYSNLASRESDGRSKSWSGSVIEYPRP